MAAGIETRHSRSCRSGAGGRCNCEPTYRVRLWDGARKERVVKPFSSIAEAQSWRKDALVAIRRGRSVETGGTQNLQVAVKAWLDGLRTGVVRARSGERYKPSAIRSYERSLRLRVLPKLGDDPIEDIGRADIQQLVDELVAAGHADSTIEATIIPLKALFRREVEQDRLKVNPTAALSVPRGTRRRERIADPAEAADLVAGVPEGDRAIWAAAMYAGLRRGELRALRADRVDLDANVLHVVAGWDDIEGEIATKGRNQRRVPIPQVLREHLLAHLMRSGRRDDDLVFGESETEPFNPKWLTQRADESWKLGELDRITLHECRHAYASLMIAAGVNAKALCDYMGHSSITVTYDRYGHLLPGNEGQAADLLDSYLARARASA